MTKATDDLAAKSGEKDAGDPPTTQAQREASADFDPATSNGTRAEEHEGQSLEDLQANGGVAEEDDGQLFVWEQGRKVTLGTLIARNIPVEHVFVFGGKRVKGRGGLMALDEAPILVVRGLSGGTKIVPTHDDDEKVVKVTIESHIASKYVMPAETEEAVALIGPIVDRVRQGRAEA